MLAQSRGSTIRQLHVSDLKEIVIPIFPPAERLILAGALNEGETSLDSLIAALEVRPKSNEAIRCFSNAPEWRSFSEMPLGAPIPEVRAALANLIATRGSEIIQQLNEPEDPFLPWMRLFVDSAKDLEQILSYPPGTDQLAALYGWRASVRDPNRPFRAAWNHLVNSLYQDSESIRSTVRNRCDRLFARVSSLSTMAVDALLENIELTAAIDPESVPAGFPAETSITIENRGPLPLRKLRLRGDGVEDREFPILPSGSAHSWNMYLKSLPTGRHIIHVVWTALRLDDRPVGGDMELAIDVSNTSERTGLLDLGESPYVYARVLDEKTENVFFGRSRAIQQIRSAISRPSASTIVLVEGNRRIGKTSLLKFFIRHHLPSDKVPVFINFQEFDGESGPTARPGIPTRKVFEGMAKELVDSAIRAYPGLELPKLGKVPEGNPFKLKMYSAAAVSLIDPEAPFASFRQLAEIIRAQIQPKRLLLIFDEFDRLQEGIESGITSDQVPENLRHLFQSWNDVSGIFTGSRTIRRLRQEYWNILFGLGETVRLSGLDLDEARGLIVEPVKGRLVYAPRAVDEICRLTARQPLIIQGICERIFRECNESGRRLVDLSMVEAIAKRFAEENEHFESIWGYVGSDRKRLITFLIEQQEAATGGATFEQLRDLLEECHLRITVRELHGDLEDLEDLEVIGKQQQTGIAKYRIEIPLFASWLRTTKDFSEFRAAAQEE
jgi:type I restriction enzyme M protein